jgi:hypothetical protein
MPKQYNNVVFLRRLLYSFFILVFSAWPMLLALFAYGETMPILKLVKVFTDDITLNSGDITSIMAFFAILILLIMITGWIFNVTSNLFLETLAVLGCLCSTANTIMPLILLGDNFLIYPAVFLAIYIYIYLTNWYFKGGADYTME